MFENDKYVCKCKPGFTGNFCETTIKEPNKKSSSGGIIAGVLVPILVILAISIVLLYKYKWDKIKKGGNAIQIDNFVFNFHSFNEKEGLTIGAVQTGYSKCHFEYTHFEKIHSRHSNRVKYKVFVKLLPNSNDIKSLEWVCSCKSGKRTVGCCTHVASVIYYLECGHRNKIIPTPGIRLNSLLEPICLNTEDSDEVKK
ncbi:unnamed protein product [Brachionus calyciflorus]|uniref:EGF-like domain-containing protein n=1 Tax=Brachionus calyciflorus TaxID=104777 RepID=A0A814EJT1_9BILA|nr:unnamed protein product [Brachionus calyciflorus]